uniref:Metal-nicotianamine transporter YSL7 n=1 Tax=Aegilops tauschii subsp. strangulata TaxID=200361 RepID=A0A453FUT1_AEGTS
MEPIGDPREGPSTERAFEEQTIPPWTEQVTPRAVVASLVLGAAFSGVMMNLVFTSGIVPTLNITAGLLGFFLLKAWTRLLDKLGVFYEPFTRHENVVVQTCVVACASMTYSGGFGSYLLAMDHRTAEKINTGEVHGRNVSEPTLPRIMAFYFLISFVGILAIIPMRKTMIIRHRLTFPSGSATAHLINSFHTPYGAMQAKKQVSLMIQSCLGSFFVSIFQWFYSGGPHCGMTFFPSFGLAAFNRGFYLNLNGTYVGVGMISPYLINISMLVGAIVSWGFMWPYIETKEGSWYAADLQEGSLRGINGYKVFGAIGMILGDGIFQLVVIMVRTLQTMRHHQLEAAEALRSFSDANAVPRNVLSFDDRRRTQVFLREHVPGTLAMGGYAALALLSTVAIPHLYGQVRHYHVATAYVFAPLLAFCNAYGTGVAETNFAAQYSKLVILLFASWIGYGNGGVVGSLVICGVVSSVVSTASDFMSDFKTGIGCVVNPAVFTVFHHFYEEAGNKIYQVPAVAIDMCVGSLVLYLWTRSDRDGAQAFGPVLASGLICGDGLFSIPYALLARYGVTPPICIRFVAREQNDKLDAYLATVLEK